MKTFGLFLMEVGQEERQVDIMRQVLSEQKKFKPFEAFRFLSSPNGAGHIGYKELSLFLKMNKIVHNKFEAICLVKALDQDNDEVIGYSDFLNFINYKSNSSSTSSKSKATNSSLKLSVDVQYALSRLFERELELHRKLEGLKNQLINEHKVSIQETYFYILPTKITGDGFTLKHLKHFLAHE